MNKALHAFVYLFLALAGAALWFELQLNAKRTLLTARNRLQEDIFVKLAKTIEKDEPAKDAVAEIKKDVAPIEAKNYDTPDTENILEDYKSYLEQQNLDTFNWDGKRDQLRMIYKLDSEGNPYMEGGLPVDYGPGTERELLEALLAASSRQQGTLNTTRAELVKLRGILADTVDELNDLKPKARQDKVTIVEKEEKIDQLEKDKADAEAQIVKLKGEKEDLNGEIASLRDEVQAAKDEAAQAAEKLEEAEKKAANLAQALKEAYQTAGATSAGGGAATAVTYGEKGKVLLADNEFMFAEILFSDAAMKELKGEKLDKPLPAGIEFTIKRTGYNGSAGDIIGRVRTRQEVPGKNYVICDILSAWAQDGQKVEKDDVVFSD